MQSMNNKEEKSQKYNHIVETRGHKLNINEAENLAAETRENPRPIVEDLHTKLNKKSINEAWEVPRCCQGLLEKTKTVRTSINR